MAAKRDESLQPELGRSLCRVRTEEGNYRGYKKDILTENLSERDNTVFACSRCKGILRELCLSTDGEQFCSCCKKEREQTHPNIHVNNAILCFKCCCPLISRGCDWLGTLGDCENHLDMCGYVQEMCKLKCGVVLQRNDHVTHEKENCVQRIVKCEHCEKNFKFCELPQHLDVCPKMKVSCDLKCGVVMCRDKVVEHINRDCKEKEIECPFAKYKCVGLIKRQYLDTHLEEKETVHLKLKVNAIEDIVMKQKEIIEKQDKTISKQREIIETILQEIEFLKSSMKLLKKRADYVINLQCRIDKLPYYLVESVRRYFNVVGYLLQFTLCGCRDTLMIDVRLKDGLDYDKLDWPFRAKFVTRVNCNDSNNTKVFKSEVIEIQREDVTSKFRIATMSRDKMFTDGSLLRDDLLDISIIFC